MIYAHKGEVITCTQGHPICTFARDVEVGGPFDPSTLVDWKQPEPGIGTYPVPLCAVCGSAFVGDGRFHFADGWRPSRFDETSDGGGSEPVPLTADVSPEPSESRMDEPSPTRYLVIDTETSGLFDFKKPADHESQPRLAAVTMISVGADLTVEDERTLYIKPDGWEMKPDATRINGLTTEMLEDRGVPVAEALDIYALEIRRGSVVVAFNAQFDTKMLRGEMRRAGIDDLFEKTPNICVMRALAGRVPGKKGWPKLKDACAHFRIDLKSAHTSVGDARAALEILRILVKEGTCPPAEVHYAKNRPQDGTTGD